MEGVQDFIAGRRPPGSHCGSPWPSPGPSHTRVPYAVAAPLARTHALLATLVVALLVVASGAYECGPPTQTVAQQRGHQLYATMCAVCHAADGAGYAADHAPALSQHDFLASVTDDALRLAITNGRPGTTMSAWGNTRGGPLRAGDVDAVIAFLRSWQLPPAASLDESLLGGDATRGEAIYASECATCHGPDGKGATFESLRGDLLATASNGFLRYAIRRGRPGTAMPSFSATLGSRTIDDVITFLRSWPPPPAAPPRAGPARMPPLPLGPVPLNPHGPEPEGFSMQPKTTHADLVKAQLDRGALGNPRRSCPIRLCQLAHRRRRERPFLRSDALLRGPSARRVDGLLLRLPACRIRAARAEAREGGVYEGDRARRGARVLANEEVRDPRRTRSVAIRPTRRTLSRVLIGVGRGQRVSSDDTRGG